MIGSPHLLAHGSVPPGVTAGTGQAPSIAAIITDAIRPRRIRSMAQFAEDEIIIPDGQARKKFSLATQPYCRHWFAAIDSGRWNRFVATGPIQSGKSMHAWVIPILYHLFELGETVIAGLPDLEMAADKWRENLKPVIDRTRYAALIPKEGGGSRGASVATIKFLNGATLKWMSGGGGDKSRSAFSSRVLVMTEIDGFDRAAATSRESDKVTQMEARTLRYGRRARIYMECSVSNEQGRTWREWTESTQSTPLLPCPHCGKTGVPERDQLIGWEECEAEVDVLAQSHFICPFCAEAWTAKERLSANQQSTLTHRFPERLTFGFRWTAAHNLFLDAGDLGLRCWRAKRSEREDEAEREICQQLFAIPPVSTFAARPLQDGDLLARQATTERMQIPEDAEHVVLGVDINKRLAHWTLLAKRPHNHVVVAYGRAEIPSDDVTLERAVAIGLSTLRDELAAHLTVPLAAAYIDTGWVPQTIFEWCLKQPGGAWLPILGRGTGQTKKYLHPRATSTGIGWIGLGCYAEQLRDPVIWRIVADVDLWKTRLWDRLHSPGNADEAVLLHRAPLREHTWFAKHLTSERATELYVPGKGQVKKWEQIRSANHGLDSTVYALVASHVTSALTAPPQVAGAGAPPAAGGITHLNPAWTFSTNP